MSEPRSARLPKPGPIRAILNTKRWRGRSRAPGRDAAVLDSELSQGPGVRWTRGVISAGRITKVGLWMVLITLILSLAAANTGNNSLYLVIAAMVSALLIAWFVARANVLGLEFHTEPVEDVYAGSPVIVRYRLRRRVAGLSSDVLLVVESSRSPTLVYALRGPRPRAVSFVSIGRETSTGADSTLQSGAIVPDQGAEGAEVDIARGQQEILYLRRGRHSLGDARLLSLYPMGIFRREVRFRCHREVIVLPEIFTGASIRRSLAARGWQHSSQKIGRSEDLHSLRAFRDGDDPRSIHWKQSARNPQLIFQQRSEDEARRVSLLVDSYVADLDHLGEDRFERLISEAATACVEYLERDYQVELVLREGGITFGSGPWQRRRILEALALLQPQSTAMGRALVMSRADSEALRFSLSADESVSPAHPRAAQTPEEGAQDFR